MKKILVTLAVLASVAASSYGQGTLFLSNTGGSRISTNGVQGSATASGLAGAGSFYYALLYSTSQTTVSGSAAPVVGVGTYAAGLSGWNDGMNGIYATNTTSAGRLQGAVLNSDLSFSVNGLAGGTTAQFVIIGWSGNVGSTLAQAMAWYNNGSPTSGYGWIGESAVSGPLAVGTLGSTPALTLWGAGSPNIPGFILGEVVAPVPEPGTLALAALGGASLLLFRRKK